MDVDAERLELVGGVAKRMLAKAGHEGGLTLTARPRRGVSRRRLRARPDPGRRPGGAACATRRSRSRAAASARRRPARAASRRRCGRCRSCSTIAERVRERAEPGAWIVDFTNPVGIVTRALLDAGHRAVGLCNVAIGFQRTVRAAARRRAARVTLRPRRAEPPDAGTAPSTSTARPAARAPARPRRRAGREPSACRRQPARRAGRDPVLLPPATTTPTTACSPAADGVPRAQTVAEIEASCSRLYATRR